MNISPWLNFSKNWDTGSGSLVKCSKTGLKIFLNVFLIRLREF